MRIHKLLLLSACLFDCSACSISDESPEAALVLAGLKDMYLTGFRGYWEAGMLPGAKTANGRFFLDYDQREAQGEGRATSGDGGTVSWRINDLQVMDPEHAGRDVLSRFIVLQGQFHIMSGPTAGVYQRALIHLTHFDSIPPWMAVHVIRDDLDLRSNAKLARYAQPAGTLYFHSPGHH